MTQKEKSMISQILDSIVEVQKVYTLVDFYQYIKGIEYLICVAFFIGFPMFYKYINEKPGKVSK
jgi:hypothetical protein